jgi:hypothetical protein
LKFEIKQGQKLVRTFYSIDYLQEYLEKEKAVVAVLPEDDIKWSRESGIPTLLGEIRYLKSGKPNELLYVDDPVIERMRQPLVLVITGFHFSEVA